MVIRAVFVGVLTALVSWAGYSIWEKLPRSLLSEPLASLGIGLLASLSYWLIIRKKPAEKSHELADRGLVDILLHIHQPRGSLTPWLWLRRGVISLFLSIFGGRAGPEGPAIEIAQAAAILTRSRSSNWLETQRRTDSSMVLSAGIAAAFGAPFAATLLPMEMGLGGSALPGALAATVATVVVNYLGVIEHYPWPGLQMWANWKDGIAIFGVTVATAMLGVGLVHFTAWARESVKNVVAKASWLKPLIGGALLTIVSLAYHSDVARSPEFVQELLAQPYSPLEAGLLALSQFLGLAIAIACFGTAGILWPLFAMGCILGYGMEPVFPGFPRTSMVAGGASFLGVVLGTPISGALLAFELTGQWTVVIPCVIAGFGATRLRAWLKTPTLLSSELLAARLEFEDGRIRSVLASLTVREAMVTNHVMVKENEPITAVKEALQKSPYPFITVVGSQGSYVGLISAEDVSEADEPGSPNTEARPMFGAVDPLIRNIVEAKDIVLKAGEPLPTVRPSERLSDLTHRFQTTPVVPVLGDQGDVIGLLFVHEVRIAYDRELARRSFLHQKGGSQ